MNSVTDFNGNTISIDNTADGLPSSLSLASTGDTTDTTYDPTDTPSDIKLTDGTTLQEFSYSDEPSGAVASETDTPTAAYEPADYTYDAQNRVTEMAPGTDTALNYGFDASGNLTALPTGTTGCYDHASELTSALTSGTCPGSPTDTYTYNDDGERTAESGATATASYNGAQELTAYSNGSADMEVACYDGDGLRQTLSTSSGSCGSPTNTFTWDPSGSLPQLLMDTTNAYIYGPADTPIEQVNLSSGTIQYLTSDLLGSVRGIVSSAGTLTASTSYDAWGNPETTGGLTAYTPFGYAGGYTDPTGLIYLIHRYYDPGTGQFLTVDSDVDQTGAPYDYADDNPANGLDRDGRCGSLVGCLNSLENLVTSADNNPYSRPIVHPLLEAANAFSAGTHDVANNPYVGSCIDGAVTTGLVTENPYFAAGGCVYNLFVTALERSRSAHLRAVGTTLDYTGTLQNLERAGIKGILGKKVPSFFKIIFEELPKWSGG